MFMKLASTFGHMTRASGATLDGVQGHEHQRVHGQDIIVFRVMNIGVYSRS